IATFEPTLPAAGEKRVIFGASTTFAGAPPVDVGSACGAMLPLWIVIAPAVNCVPFTVRTTVADPGWTPEGTSNSTDSEATAICVAGTLPTVTDWVPARSVPSTATFWPTTAAFGLTPVTVTSGPPAAAAEPARSR